MRNVVFRFAIIATIGLTTACGGPSYRAETLIGDPSDPIFEPQKALTSQEKLRLHMAQRFRQDVPTTVTFNTGSARLSRQAQAVLKQQATFIKTFPELSFMAYGHADQTGSAARNTDLSAERAAVVVAYLRHVGVPKTQITAATALGATEPVNHQTKTAVLNRRTVTEVVAVKSLSQSLASRLKMRKF